MFWGQRKNWKSGLFLAEERKGPDDFGGLGIYSPLLNLDLLFLSLDNCCYFIIKKHRFLNCKNTWNGQEVEDDFSKVRDNMKHFILKDLNILVVFQSEDLKIAVIPSTSQNAEDQDM